METPTRAGLMSIGEFARATGLSAKALRLYDEMDLLTPVEVDPFSGYRRYAASQLDRAHLVAQLRLSGMSLARIRVIADLPPRAAAAELTSYAREVAAQAAATREQVVRLVRDLAPAPGEEHQMNSTITTVSAGEAGLRIEQGGRDAQLDAAHASAGVYVVADGFGDDPDAARLAVQKFTTSLGEDRSLDAVDEAVAAASTAVAGCAAGSGCTLTALVLAGGDVLVAHIGDSRAYRVREGRLEQLTRDHSVVQFLVDEGRLTPEEARLDDQRVVLHRALAPLAPDAGADVGAPDLAVHRVLPSDRLVLTTDGVHARLDAPTLAALLLAEAPAPDVADAVVDAVRTAGADDNLTVVVVDLLSAG
ncbi:MerR family transcriptional regulator [soil metagenome]